jgi:hypothetical protein
VHIFARRDQHFSKTDISPLGRPRHWWIDNIKMDLLEIGLGVVDWIGQVQDRYRRRALVNMVMNHWVP